MADNERWLRGAAVVKQLMGVDVSNDPPPDDFRRVSFEHLFGEIWTRPNLEMRERSMITVSILAAMGRETELKGHIRGALHIGIPRATINEMMLHIAHYAGWPAGATGQRLAKEVYAELDAKDAKDAKGDSSGNGSTVRTGDKGLNG